MSKGWSNRELTEIAMMTAVTCVIAPFILPLPFSPVPISLVNLILILSVYFIGLKKAMISYLLYLLIGLAGLPVFSGFSGGVGKVFGPTGGYLIGFWFLIWISGIIINNFPEQRWIQMLGVCVGLLVADFFGTLWLKVQAGVTFQQALLMGVVPFLLGDIIKMILACTFAPMLKKTLFAARGSCGNE